MGELAVTEMRKHAFVLSVQAKIEKSDIHRRINVSFHHQNVVHTHAAYNTWYHSHQQASPPSQYLLTKLQTHSEGNQVHHSFRLVSGINSAGMHAVHASRQLGSRTEQRGRNMGSYMAYLLLLNAPR